VSGTLWAALTPVWTSYKTNLTHNIAFNAYFVEQKYKWPFLLDFYLSANIVVDEGTNCPIFIACLWFLVCELIVF
jgi:hypothetical protein